MLWAYRDLSLTTFGIIARISHFYRSSGNRLRVGVGFSAGCVDGGINGGVSTDDIDNSN
jgi:hypothetical protein